MMGKVEHRKKPKHGALTIKIPSIDGKDQSTLPAPTSSKFEAIVAVTNRCAEFGLARIDVQVDLHRFWRAQWL